jgi:Conserved oligomeric complex COG6
MLGWVHQAIAGERDTLESLFGDAAAAADPATAVDTAGGGARGEAAASPRYGPADGLLVPTLLDTVRCTLRAAPATSHKR